MWVRRDRGGGTLPDGSDQMGHKIGQNLYTRVCPRFCWQREGMRAGEQPHHTKRARIFRQLWLTDSTHCYGHAKTEEKKKNALDRNTRSAQQRNQNDRGDTLGHIAVLFLTRPLTLAVNRESGRNHWKCNLRTRPRSQTAHIFCYRKWHGKYKSSWSDILFFGWSAPSSYKALKTLGKLLLFHQHKATKSKRYGIFTNIRQK